MYNVNIQMHSHKQGVLNIMGILAIVIQHENCIFSVQHYISTCGLPGSTIFFHIIS